MKTGTFRQNVRFSHPNEQCKEGYGGPLCGSCAARYVRKPDLTCEYCETGPSPLSEPGSNERDCHFFSRFSSFLCCDAAREKRSRWIPQRTKLAGLIGQFKIFLTFVQLLGFGAGRFGVSAMADAVSRIHKSIKVCQLSISLGLFRKHLRGDASFSRSVRRRHVISGHACACHCVRVFCHQDREH